jgi:hypothetical protein
MSEDAKVYDALLRGLAQVAQDHLCARGEHAWGRWIRTDLLPQRSIPTLSDVLVCQSVDITIETFSDRRCDNCGHAQYCVENKP